MLGSKAQAPTAEARIDGVADTGCSVLCSGVDICKKFKLKPSRQLTALGYLPVNISVQGSATGQRKSCYTLCRSLKGPSSCEESVNIGTYSTT